MPWSGFAGWVFNIALADLLAEVRGLLQIDDLSKFGADASTQNTLMASLINRTVARYLNANPALGLTTKTQALTASTNGYAIPTDLRQCDIRKIWFPNTLLDGAHDLEEIAFLPRGAVSAMDATLRNSTIQYDWPEAWYFSDNGSQIVFIPMPNNSTISVVIGYRPRATAITASNVGTPGSVNITEVPSIHQDVIALGVAAQAAKFLYRPDRPAMVQLRATLWNEWDNPTPGGPPGALQRAQREIAAVIAENTTAGRSLMPRTGALATEAALAQLAVLGGGSRSPWSAW